MTNHHIADEMIERQAVTIDYISQPYLPAQKSGNGYRKSTSDSNSSAPKSCEQAPQ
ncbi:conserved hypothetical protein [Trichinella spiralis]|uniref:hypothetical protein n=1 Tax=Trichinella spiralis TaxID=6334 RepID=UPI0001EFC21C|nr:conserved hypothetical protein [Trichinella spiralis]